MREVRGVEIMSYQIGPSIPAGEHPWPDGWEWSPTVARCPHNEWESVLLLPGRGRWRGEEIVRCVACHAPRCGYSGDSDPCMLQRHHRIHHVSESGKLEPIGGYKCANGVGCGCGARYAS